MKKTPLNGENFHQAFEQITCLLLNFQDIWRHKPFVEDELTWQGNKNYQYMYQQLLNLTDDQLEQFEQESNLVNWLGEFLPTFLDANCWCLAPSSHGPVAVAKFADVGMPGRKKTQIEHFVGSFAPFYERGNRQFDGIKPDGSQDINPEANQVNRLGVMDWCCGKGHLAGLLHQQLGCNTLGLEYDEQLVVAARTKSTNKLNFECVDVLKPIEQSLFDGIAWHSGLHACGDLHVQLLKQAVDLGHGAVIAPCCYHLVQSQCYLPLSHAAKNSGLFLSKDDLRLAVLQTVTSGQRVKRIRQTELLWRTAFDLWYRDKMQLDKYTPMTSVAKHWFSGSFDVFCQHLAGLCGVTIPADFDGEHYLALAQQKMNRVKRLEFARLGFRPALELWLLLDRALYMQEQGYEVDLMTFCDVKLTPRNGLIIARR